MSRRPARPVGRRPHPGQPGVALACAVLGLVCLIGIAPSLFAPHDPYQQNLPERLCPPVWLPGGHWDHLLGTDAVGRDVLSRMIFGARISLSVGLFAVIVSGTLGVTAGIVAGYFRGPADDLIMRIAEVQLAFPFILAAVAIVSVLGRASGI